MNPEAPLDTAEKYIQIRYRVYERSLSELAKFLDERGMRYILIKGWSAAQYYPKPWTRKLGDVDLVFDPEDIDTAAKLLSQYDALPIDLHKGARHLDTFDFEKLYEKSLLLTCNDTRIRVLRPEDHLRIICTHWLNDGGAYKEKLWDVYYLIESSRGSFDWEECLGKVAEKRRQWVFCAIGLAHEYLGLEIDYLPARAQIENVPGWIRQTVEKEWKSTVRLAPLEVAWANSLRDLFRQISKRVPPNALQAYIECDKRLADDRVLKYQLENVFQRGANSLRKRFYAGKK